MPEMRETVEQGAKQADRTRRLPSAQRAAAAESKYADALKLYASSELTIREVARLCAVTPAGFSAHLARHHRQLLFDRYGLDINGSNPFAVKVKQPKGQSLRTYLKYKDAIEACGDIAYIEFNVSQVARLFALDGPALANQLRVHYPDIIPTRERMRQKLGIADNTPRGARQTSAEIYAKALEMYRDTDLSIPETAKACNVSQSGFSQFMRFYHKNIVEHKAAKRREAIDSQEFRRPGKLSGNGSL